MKRSSIVAAIIIFACIAGVAGGLAAVKYRSIMQAKASAVQYEPVMAVEFVEAQQIMWQREAELVGTVFSLRSVQMSNELAGRVTNVQFESGAIVEEGQVLLQLDASSDEAELAVAQAAERVAEAEISAIDVRVSLAELERSRLANAASARAVSEMDLDRAEAELKRIKAERERLVAQLEQARAQARLVQTRIDKMTIRAPFRSRAGLRLVHEGQFLEAASKIVMLEEVATHIYLDFAIPQEYLDRVRPGVTVMATSAVLGPDPTPIEVVAVDSSVSNATRNIRVRSIVDNSADRLRAGMFVRVRVPVEPPAPRVVVPGTAVRRASHADNVFVVKPDPESPGSFRASYRLVRLGPSVGDKVVVDEGLEAGESIVAIGSFKLHDGMKLMPVVPGQSAPGASTADKARTDSSQESLSSSTH